LLISIKHVGFLQVSRTTKIWNESLNSIDGIIVLIDFEPKGSIKQVVEGLSGYALKVTGFQILRLRSSG